jgi:hypothetical protein
MTNLVTTDDGVTLASVTEAAADSARLVRERSLYSTSPNGFLTGSDTIRSLGDIVNPVSGAVTKGYANTFCANGLKYRDYYYNWNSGHRHVLNLREGESYTRYYRPLGTTPEYWVGSEKASSPNPANTYQIDAPNKFGLRGNGAWTYEPDLSSEGWSRAAYQSSNISAASFPGIRPATAGQIGDATYKVQAGNAIASLRIAAEFSRIDPEAAASVSISLNHGTSWTDVGSLDATIGGAVPLTVNLRNEVNGAYEALVRVRMRSAASSPDGIVLTRLRVDTVTQLNVKALPKLNLGRNEVVVGLGDQTDTLVLWPDLRGDRWRTDVADFSNIASQPVTVPQTYTAVVYPAVLSQDAYLTYRMDAPTDITRVVYGGRLHNYRSGSYIDFLHSFDGGATWVRSYRLSSVSKPYDVIHYETVTNVPQGVRSVLFKFLIHNTNTGTSRASGLYSARMEVNHRPAQDAPRPLDVTWRWNEVRADRTLVARSHRQKVTAFPLQYVINVGGADHPVMDSIRINIEDPGDPAPYGYGDGIDAGGQKHVPRQQRVGTNYATGRPYSFSRPPSGFQSSAGASNVTILTDGVVGAPATGGISYWSGQCWTSGSTVDLQLDLGQPRAVGAIRAHLLGYPAWDAFKGEVQDQVELLTSIDGVSFTSHGMLPTSLWRKDLPVNYMLQDDEKGTAWNFEKLLAAPVSARYVRYRMTPRRHLCATELQVLDRIDYDAFDLRIALPDSDTEVTVPALVGLTEDAARVAIAGAGLTVGPVTQENSSTVPAGIVLAQAPAEGTAASPASPVALVVSAGPTDPSAIDEVVMHVAGHAQVLGGWSVVPDATAAGGARLQNPNAYAPKLNTPLAAPTQAFDLTFDAEAGKGYRIWIRGKALNNSYTNDSVFVQFSGSVTAAGVPNWRIGTTDATTIVLEDCSGCWPHDWGWADNGYGAGALGPLVYFAQTGPQRLRIQMREDGLGIDQVVLSAVQFVTARPGATIDDLTILPATVP